MIKLLTISSELESAQKLGFETVTEFQSDFVSDLSKDIVVRWGNSGLYYKSKTSYTTCDFDNVINPSSAIRKNCHKLRALQTLAEIVDIPKIYHDAVPKEQKIVLRRTEHAAGSDFFVKTGPMKVDYGYYATEFIETETEYRVWFCGKETFACKRVPLNQADEKAFPCRANWGYSYLPSVPKSLHNKTLAAAKKIGLEIGAADILVSNGKYFFLELNSAPSIDTNSLIRFYKNGVEKLAKQKFPNLFP
jgi:hypothetical protein